MFPNLQPPQACVLYNMMTTYIWEVRLVYNAKQNQNSVTYQRIQVGYAVLFRSRNCNSEIMGQPCM